MTRYELIKVYPGGPKKGTVVYTPHKWSSSTSGDIKYKMRNYKNTDNQLYFSEYEIEKFPTFWKKL